MPDVFISYSADAKKLAERLACSLQKEGVATWSDFENVSPGERLYDQLQQALDQAITGALQQISADNAQAWFRLTLNWVQL